MKRQHIFIALSLMLSAFSMQSCLDFDTTGDEFNSTTSNVEKVTNRGKVDSIPYKSVVSAQKVDEIATSLKDNLSAALGAQLWMRGGKKGENPGPHAYQYQFCLGVDNYAQYGVVPHTNFIYSKINITSTYNIDPKAYGGAMSSFKGMANACIPLLNSPKVDSIPEVKALFLLLLDYSAIEVADIYGPFPYQDIKTNKQVNPYNYDDVRTIYMKVGENLDNILACFHNFESKPEDYQRAILKEINRWTVLTKARFEGGDKDLNTWIKFANSFKLRMAMHMQKVEPQLAQQWAEAAVKDGVIDDVKDEIRLAPMIMGFQSPLLGVYDWGDTRMTASMESLLKSLNHPYVHIVDDGFEKHGYLFDVIPNDIINSKTKKVTKARTVIAGMRSGAHPGEGQNYDGNQYVAFSSLNKQTFGSAPFYLMKLSEVCFLRAEGAIRGWNMGGTAQEFYEKGIKYGSFEDRDLPSQTYMKDDQLMNTYDALIGDYMNQEHPTPFTYVDPTGDTPDQPSVTKIGVKWNEGDSKEIKLEKIITQKYIAGFPYSFEAFVDLRRTGYPKLFEVLNADEGDGSIQQGQMIRRLPFPGRDDAATKQDIDATGMKALGGADQCGTRLWWDVPGSNF